MGKQPVPATAAFLQDDLAVMVVEGLLNQIELMRRQCVSTLEQIECVGKCKAPTFKEPMVEPKQARAPLQCPQELVWAPVHTVVRLPPQPLKLASRVSTSRSVCTDPVPMHRVQELNIPAESLAELLLEASDQIMSDTPAVQQKQRSEVPQAPVASSSKAGASSQGGARVVPELPVLHVQPTVAESHRLSPQADTSKMDIVNFSSNVLTQAGPGQMLFLHAVAIPAPPPQLAVVVVTTDPRTPEQYDRLVATQQKAAAASKCKGKIVLTLSNESNYGELLSKHERESEEGESVAQRFQRVQYNKKLATKKANKAKAEAALEHRAINDFSGRIPNGLGVKVWRPLDKLDESLLDKTMQALLYNPLYKDLQSPIWGKEDKDFVIPRHIPMRFTHVKEDGTTVLHVMRAPDPSQLFNLEQIAQYVLIFGWPELENTWQGIAFDFAYCMHWQTLFGFTLCQALCTTSAAKPAVVRWLALVMA
ncbi:hypothetical protein C0995_010524 [Termitomyces sp. Mi166|nr:hypothetical protein C0995_010524 [Termitomyces sp. Mi166\